MNDIIQYIENYKFDENEIKQKFCKMMETIRSREKGWDIKVAELLEIDDFDEIEGYDIRDDIGFEAPIWTGIKQTLGLVYPEKKKMRIGMDEILGSDSDLPI